MTRLQEYNAVQLHFYKTPPDNYGLITSLLMHLCRHTVYTPIPLAGYLRDALRDVNMDGIMHRFGAVFLQDLDLKKCRLPCLQQQNDSPEILYHMDADRKDRRRRKQPVHIPNTYPNDAYPLGENPPWGDIVRSIKGNPSVLMKDLASLQFWSQTDPAYRIFVTFTGDMIHGVNPDMWKGKRCPTLPKTIEEALQFWTVANLSDLLPNGLFLAQNASILGNTRQRRHPTFREMISIFFPEPDVSLHPKSVWHLYTQHGYLKQLHDVERMLLHDANGEEGEDHVEALRYSLGDMLSTVQCLPDATLGSAQKEGALWKGKGGQIHLLTNSRFYRLKSIGTGPPKKRATVAQPRASKAHIGERLAEVHGGVPGNVTKKKKYALSRMSQKRKNYRPPPQRKATAQPTEEEDDGPSAPSAIPHTQTLAEPRRTQRSTAGRLAVVVKTVQETATLAGVSKKGKGASNASSRQTRSGEHDIEASYNYVTEEKCLFHTGTKQSAPAQTRQAVTWAADPKANTDTDDAGHTKGTVPATAKQTVATRANQTAIHTVAPVQGDADQADSDPGFLSDGVEEIVEDDEKEESEVSGSSFEHETTSSDNDESDGSF
jgi:hypothetical protein